MNHNHKLLVAVGFGLVAMAVIAVHLQATLINYDLLSLDRGDLMLRGHARVLGATTVIITISSPASGAVLPAGTASVPLTAATDQPATCSYSSSGNDLFSDMTAFDVTGNTTTHLSTLAPLTNGSAYAEYVQCADASGNITPKAVVVFSVASPAAPAADTALPAISNVSLVSLSATTTVISWNTDQATDGQVEYGPIDAYGSFSPLYDSAAKTTSHTATLSGLFSNFTYHYRLRSSDALGNFTRTPDSTFTTLPETSPSWFTNFSSPPVTVSGDLRIYQAYANFITKSSASVYWYTDAPTMGQVEYGLTSGYGTSTPLNGQLFVTHGEDLDNLLPDTTYHYRIIAADYNGHKGVSGDGWFKTLASSSPSAATVPLPVQAPPQTGVVMPAVVPSSTLAAVLPARVKDGWLIKFSKSQAVFLVKPEGLYPFESLTVLKKYQKISRQRIRYYSGSPGRYTVLQTPAGVLLGL